MSERERGSKRAGINNNKLNTSSFSGNVKEILFSLSFCSCHVWFRTHSIFSFLQQKPAERLLPSSHLQMSKPKKHCQPAGIRDSVTKTEVSPLATSTLPSI